MGSRRPVWPTSTPRRAQCRLTASSALPAPSHPDGAGLAQIEMRDPIGHDAEPCCPVSGTPTLPSPRAVDVRDDALVRGEW
jgi:hypothetical protein